MDNITTFAKDCFKQARLSGLVSIAVTYTETVDACGKSYCVRAETDFGRIFSEEYRIEHDDGEYGKYDPVCNFMDRLKGDITKQSMGILKVEQIDSAKIQLRRDWEAIVAKS